MKTLLTTMVLVATTTISDAGPLADALARHGEQDLEVLRGQRDDVAARCTLGAVYAQRNDLSRAALYLTGCDEVSLPDDISTAVARIDRDLKKRLEASDLAQIQVVTNPDHMIGEIDALPHETFTTPATLYLKAGDYTIQASKGGMVLKNIVHAQKRSRGAVVLEAGPHVTPVATKDRQLDYSEDNLTEAPTTGGPKDIKHKNLMNDKYQKGIAATSTIAPNPNAIDDPMVVRETPRTARPYSLGLRLGGGMFDDGAAGARAGIAVAATARFSLAGRTFLAGRLDWSRRGGELAVDAVGASAGIGATVFETRTVGIALLAQLRGDVRLAASRGDSTMTVPVSRTGAAAAAGVELSLPRTPFSAGLRFEQGLTTLVPGARDRAVLFELGVDWR